MRSLLKQIGYKILKIMYGQEKFANTYAIKIAREVGVKVGKDCRFYSLNFSSEPYLIEIGNHVTITEGVKFITHDGGIWVLRGMDNKYEHANILGKIKVGDNVFIGIDTIILPGVEIGDNSIIAAGSVVTKSFTGNSIIAGTPAKEIKDINEYIEQNKDYLVNTKNMTVKDKKEFINKSMNISQFRIR